MCGERFTLWSRRARLSERLPRLCLGHISATSQLYLGCISATSQLYLGYISRLGEGLLEAAREQRVGVLDGRLREGSEKVPSEVLLARACVLAWETWRTGVLDTFFSTTLSLPLLPDSGRI